MTSTCRRLAVIERRENGREGGLAREGEDREKGGGAILKVGSSVWGPNIS